PYSSTSTVYGAIAQLERTLNIPTCKKHFPQDIGRERPCVYYQMGRCMGVCTGKVSPSEYREAIDRAADILRGGTRDVIVKLTEQMMRASDDLEFEEAARCRDAIEALRKLGERQKAVGSPDVECDVIGLHLTSYDGGEVKFRDSVSVFYVRSGYIADSEHFLFGGDEITALSGEDTDDDSPMLAFIYSLYQSREYIPPEILLSFELPERERLLLADCLSERAGHKVTIRTPKKGASRYLCEMAVTDAAKHSENQSKRDRNDERTLANLASLLHLEVLPERIEAYDISNLGDEHITAGMIVFEDGKPKKSEYRVFSIKSTSSQDDYGAMSEAIRRRIAHIGREDDNMTAYPDLFLLDGGKGHVSVIRQVLAEEGLDIPVFGMVKDEHHKTRTLTDGEGEIDIARQQDVFRLIYGIQEEVHRFTVSRMTNAKRKTLKTSSLEKIKGIGPAKSRALHDRFRTITAMKTASVDDLAETPGISRTDAEAIYLFFHQNSKGETT
ncbi:MAG: excinuclease ABC subunit C, partial [Clostridia bacterium]|nr:excinuclease ABC subunit C [Clostridia bacterium]